MILYVSVVYDVYGVIMIQWNSPLDVFYSQLYYFQNFPLQLPKYHYAVVAEEAGV